MWTDSDDRAGVTAASYRIEAAIRNDPFGAGESREDDMRYVFDPPLAVLYEVDRLQQVAIVTAVRPQPPTQVNAESQVVQPVLSSGSRNASPYRTHRHAVGDVATRRPVGEVTKKLFPLAGILLTRFPKRGYSNPSRSLYSIRTDLSDETTCPPPIGANRIC